jgi:hypothetical protein
MKSPSVRPNECFPIWRHRVTVSLRDVAQMDGPGQRVND